MKHIYFLVLVLLVCSCKEKTTEVVLDENGLFESVVQQEEYIGEEPTSPEATEVYKPVPAVVVPESNDTAAPSDAIVLFNGDNFNDWSSSKDSTAADWHLNIDGSMTVKNLAGDIQTKRNFGNVQVHVEWMSPSEIQGKGQSRANSGIFLQNRYEIQVLDNNDNDTYVNGQVGAIYKQTVPLVRASRQSGQWNTYDIVYHAPEFNAEGNKVKSATITVLHNGILIQDHVEIKGTTPYIGWPKNEAHGKAPIRLQDHGDNSRVSYRNIWVREL